MKWLNIALLAVVVLAFSPAKPADAAVAFGFSAGFHDELSPYGAWVNYSNYGNCWRPSGYSGYRPYVDGYWAYSNYGPTWYGNEAWAPYTYNYGQWIYTAQFGWIWVPGNDWHRNYVDWTYGGGYIGWRPQFPAGYYYPGGNDFNLWVVIDSNHFGYRDYRPYVYRSDFVRNLWDRRVFRQRYDRMDRVQLERITRRPVQTVNLRERDVRIGNRNTRMFVTPDQETRIQKHVEQVRRRDFRDERQFNDRKFNERNDRQFNERNDRQFNDRKNNDRRSNDHENVMRQRFDDIRSKSDRNYSKERDRQFDQRRENVHQNVDRRELEKRNNVVRHDSRNFEPQRRIEEPRKMNRPENDRGPEMKRSSHEERFSTVHDRREVTRSEQHGRSDVRVNKSRPEKKHQDNKPPYRH